MPAEKEPVFRRYDPKQTLILPPDLNEWLPPNHLARIVAQVVDDHLDLAPLVASYENEEGGRPAFHPRMLLKVVLYGYCVGVGSSRKLEKATYEDVATRWLATDQHPHFTTLARFRRKCLPLMDDLFHQVLELGREVGLVKLGRVALDGTKIKASASKHKSKSYRKIVEEERDLRAVAPTHCPRGGGGRLGRGSALRSREQPVHEPAPAGLEGASEEAARGAQGDRGEGAEEGQAHPRGEDPVQLHGPRLAHRPREREQGRLRAGVQLPDRGGGQQSGDRDGGGHPGEPRPTAHAADGRGAGAGVGRAPREAPLGCGLLQQGADPSRRGEGDLGVRSPGPVAGDREFSLSEGEASAGRTVHSVHAS